MTLFQSTKTHALGVKAVLIRNGNSARNGETCELQGLAATTKLINESVVVNGLKLNWENFTSEKQSSVLLKDFKAFLKKPSHVKKIEGCISLEICFGDGAASVPWIQTFIDMANKKVEFQRIECSWSYDCIDLEEALRNFWEYRNLGPEATPSPLVLVFHPATSLRAEAVLNGLAWLLDKTSWPVETVVLRLVELESQHIPISLKKVLSKLSSDFRFLIEGGSEKRIEINQACARKLLEVLSSMSYCVIKDILFTFGDQLPEIFFRSNPAQTQRLVFGNLSITHLSQLINNGWVLDTVTREEKSSSAITLRKGFAKSIAAFTSMNVLKPLLLEENCFTAALKDMNLGLQELLKFQIVKKSSIIRVTARQRHEELDCSSDVTCIKSKASLMDVLKALEHALSEDQFSGLRSLEINVKNENVTESVKLRIAQFRKDMKVKHKSLFLCIYLGDKTGAVQQEMLEADFSLSTILEEKIRSAAETGKFLHYSRPKLITLGPRGSGKTSTLCSLLENIVQEPAAPTVMAQNNWLLKVSSNNVHNNGMWIVSEVDEKNNGMASELGDIEASINYKNTNTIFTSNAALRSKRMIDRSFLKEHKKSMKSEMSEPENTTKQVLGLLKKMIPSQRIFEYSKVSIWDTSGSDCILIDHIMSTGAIYLLNLSIPDYIKEVNDDLTFLEAVIEEWVDYLAVYSESSQLFVVGTSCSAVSVECLAMFNETVVKQVGDRISLVKNSMNGFSFFPMDNNEREDMKSQITSLKTAIAQSLPWFVEGVPVSWLYFMDIIFHTEKVLISIKELKVAAAEHPINENDIPKIIDKYSKMGAILRFKNSNFIVLKPAAFIEAYRSIFEHVSDSGLVNAQSLLEVLSNYLPLPETCHNFLQLCEETTLICCWPSEDVSNHTSLIPFKLQPRTEEIQLSKDESWSLFIAWEKVAPKSFFVDMIALLLTAVVNMGCSSVPEVYEDVALFSLRGFHFGVIKHHQDIEIRFSREFTAHFLILTEACETFAEQLGKKGMVAPTVVVESSLSYRNKSQMYRSRWKDVQQILCDTESEELVPVFQEKFGIPVTAFNAFEEVYQQTRVETQLTEYDMCVLHEFEEIVQVDGAPEQASDPNLVLDAVKSIQRNRSIWIDDGEFNGFDVNFAPSAIENSGIVVIVLSKRYLNELHNPRSRASSQLDLVVKKGVHKLMLFSADADLIDRSAWGESVIGFHLVSDDFVKVTNISGMNATEIAVVLEENIQAREALLNFKLHYGS